MAFNLNYMDVILNEDVKALGYRGDIVKVKLGYFRNFLFPNGLADVATPARKKLAEKRRETMVMKQSQALENAKEVVEKLSGLKLVLTERANEKGHLYAGVSETEVARAIEAEGKVVVAPSAIKMEHFKEVGEYEVKVTLGKEEAVVKVVVKAE